MANGNGVSFPARHKHRRRHERSALPRLQRLFKNADYTLRILAWIVRFQSRDFRRA